jgi:hypothetical protein
VIGSPVTGFGRFTLAIDELLEEIRAFCRRAGLAETTFGRLSVNDGKLVSRLRDGRRLAPSTRERIRRYILDHWNDRLGPGVPEDRAVLPEDLARLAEERGRQAQSNFRFFDNRQKYLLFVNTCSEKQVIADRVAAEIDGLTPSPPGLRIFDAGMGDGTVLSRTLRALHAKLPLIPFYVVGKEISWEDVRLALEKLPERFVEHPATVLVLTNLYYRDAPWLVPRDQSHRDALVWREIALDGGSSHGFERQIESLRSELSDVWRARVSPATGVPVYERPVVLVLYRADHRFLLEPMIPRAGGTRADFDLVVASQPYRARASTEFKTRRVLAPLTRALGRGGRLVGVHSHGGDPGQEIIRALWPGDDPFAVDRHQLLKALKAELGADAANYVFGAGADARSVFRFDMHTLPGEIAGTIGTSTLLAAWNAAIYVGQIEDHRLAEAMRDGHYVEATASVLKRHGGLWFNDESYVVTRRRD